MSKGIVVEQHRKYLVVLTNEGMFEKAVPVSGVDVGTEIAYQPLRPEKSVIGMLQNKKKVGLLAIACVLVLLLSPVYFLGDAKNTYAYVNVDINPSLELTINGDMKIRSVKPLNADARKLIHQMKELKGQKLAVGLQTIMASSEEQHMIKNGKQMLVSVNQKSGKIEVAERISNMLHANDEWQIATISIPDEVRKKAVEKNVSMNKLVAEEALATDKKNGDNEKKVHISKKERAIIHHIYKQPVQNGETDKRKKKSSADKMKISPKQKTERTDKTVSKQKSGKTGTKKNKTSKSKQHNNTIQAKHNQSTKRKQPKNRAKHHRSQQHLETHHVKQQNDQSHRKPANKHNLPAQSRAYKKTQKHEPHFRSNTQKNYKGHHRQIHRSEKHRSHRRYDHHTQRKKPHGSKGPAHRRHHDRGHRGWK